MLSGSKAPRPARPSSHSPPRWAGRTFTFAPLLEMQSARRKTRCLPCPQRPRATPAGTCAGQRDPAGCGIGSSRGRTSLVPRCSTSSRPSTLHKCPRIPRAETHSLCTTQAEPERCTDTAHGCIMDVPSVSWSVHARILEQSYGVDWEDVGIPPA